MKSTHLLLARFWLITCATLVLIPIAVIVAALGEFDAEIWTFLLEYQLPTLLGNTLFLVITVGFGVIALGASLAWLTAMYRFPMRSFFFLGNDAAIGNSCLCTCLCATRDF